MGRSTLFPRISRPSVKCTLVPPGSGSRRQYSLILGCFASTQAIDPPFFHLVMTAGESNSLPATLNVRLLTAPGWSVRSPTSFASPTMGSQSAAPSSRLDIRSKQDGAPARTHSSRDTRIDRLASKSNASAGRSSLVLIPAVFRFFFRLYPRFVIFFMVGRVVRTRHQAVDRDTAVHHHSPAVLHQQYPGDGICRLHGVILRRSDRAG